MLRVRQIIGGYSSPDGLFLSMHKLALYIVLHVNFVNFQSVEHSDDCMASVILNNGTL